ncbi:MAG: hypothetical protein HY886_05650 [Deltaproteobacteria bacterium]|nr:hypothetical protein [Deltaproteobacteria bacterium]
MARKNSTKVIGFLLIAVFMFTGCSGSTVKYINQGADFAYIKKIAILPFNNFTEDRYAGEKVRSALTIDIMSKHVFEVMEQGEVTKVMNMLFREEGFEEGRVVQLDKEMLRLLGEKLGVQAVIQGSVNEYSGGRGGYTTNVVAISVRMLDTGSGVVLWQVNTSEVGSSTFRKMIGIDQVDMTVLTTDVVRKAVNTLL